MGLKYEDIKQEFIDTVNNDPKCQELYNKIQMGEAPPLPEFLIASHHRALGYTGTPRIYYPATKEIKILE